MLYIAFVHGRRDVAPGEVAAKSEEWWNEGRRPAGLRTVSIIGSLSTGTPDVFLFDADSHQDINEMMNFWRSVADLDVHPAVDLAALFRDQGMKID